MKIVHTDGGRKEAGFLGETGDCVTRAIAVATGLPYQEVYDLVNDAGREEKPKFGRKPSRARTGVHKKTTRAILEDLGWVWHPTMGVGTGCTVHLRAEELPGGTIIVKLSGHVACVKDGVLYDNHDCSRNGTRCVYGYWTQP